MTHNQKVLALLADGLPHNHHEGYALGVILHSRVSELRKQGHNIIAWRDHDFYVYQLVPCVGGELSNPGEWDGLSLASQGSAQDRAGDGGAPPTDSIASGEAFHPMVAAADTRDAEGRVGDGPTGYPALPLTGQMTIFGGVQV